MCWLGLQPAELRDREEMVASSPEAATGAGAVLCVCIRAP